jgi:hypothetical protein
MRLAVPAIESRKKKLATYQDEGEGLAGIFSSAAFLIMR